MRLPLRPHNSLFEPRHQLVELNVSGCNGHDKIIDRLVSRNIQAKAAALDQDLDQKPSCPFVSIDETVIVHHAFQERGRLSGYWAVIARVRPRQGGLDKMQAGHAWSAAEGQGFVVSGDRIRKREPVMAFSDPRAFSRRKSAWRKLPSERIASSPSLWTCPWRFVPPRNGRWTLLASPIRL